MNFQTFATFGPKSVSSHVRKLCYSTVFPQITLEFSQVSNLCPRRYEKYRLSAPPFLSIQDLRQGAHQSVATSFPSGIGYRLIISVFQIRPIFGEHRLRPPRRLRLRLRLRLLSCSSEQGPADSRRQRELWAQCAEVVQNGTEVAARLR